MTQRRRIIPPSPHTPVVDAASSTPFDPNPPPVAGAFQRAALELARAGLQPVPCCPKRSKRPHPRFRSWQAPRAIGELERLVADRTYANSNIGVVTGAGQHPVTVVDCDDPDLRDLLTAMLGPTPLITSTPSGGFHLFYRYDGEGCLNLRPARYAGDIKGAGGFIVVPPSQREPCDGQPGGEYRFVSGSWADLSRLPTMHRGVRDVLYAEVRKAERLALPRRFDSLTTTDGETVVLEGERNDTLFRYALRVAGAARDEGELLPALIEMNARVCRPVLRKKELEGIAISAWSYQQLGTNWVGTRGTLQLKREEFTSIESPNALWLLATLRFAHGSRRLPFAISPKAMAKTGAARGLKAAAIRAAVRELIRAGFIEEVYRGGRGKGDASKYHLTPAKK